ncbi:uncharacterized protein TrAFT101_009196 [Trichoderma asperellum]|uniref:uncharacterized protein n=1 Tax=Trichoderma asperellum TaxID=101201 RepID=UPI00331E7E20|nr:hypothetical protein TrAFT101_009196 [Trichoderma asperellum]
MLLLVDMQLHLEEATAKNTSVGSIFHLSWSKNITSADTSYATRTIHSCSSSSSANKATTLLPKNVPYICKVPAQGTKGPLIQSLHWPATLFGPRGLQKTSGATGLRLARESCVKVLLFLSLPTARAKYDRSHSSEPLEFIALLFEDCDFPIFA